MLTDFTLVAWYVMAFLILVAIYIIRRILRADKLQKQATEQYQIIRQSIFLSDTVSELNFWRDESNKFVNDYRKRIHPRLMLTFETMLSLAIKDRLRKGFEK